MRYLYILLILPVIIFSNCNRTKEKFAGPGICPTNNFKVTEELSVTQNSVDFTTGEKSVTYTAKFNEIVSWTLTIKGLTSGAKKVFQGNSSDLNVIWKGEPGNSTFFVVENTVAELTISCLNNTYTKEVAITKVSDFSTLGVLVSNFDGQGAIPGVVGADWYLYGPGWVVPESGIRNEPVTPSPQGGKYLRVVGNVPGGGYFSAGASSNSFNITSLNSTSADSIYFNAFINGNGNNNSYIAITIFEKDRKRTYLLDVNWTGWRLVSLKLSDFFPFLNPMDVSSIAFDLSAKDPAPGKNNGEENIDFIIFTKGEPFYKEQ
ncbi:MAG: hypothetical protein ACK40G_13160 [Cytophagaceae bacterium]